MKKIKQRLSHFRFKDSSGADVLTTITADGVITMRRKFQRNPPTTTLKQLWKRENGELL